MNPYIYLILLAASPVSEVRGSIPFGMAVGIPLPRIMLLSILANLLIIPLLFFILRISSFRELIFRILGKRIEIKIAKHRQRFETYEELALIPFVAIPLPITGAYTAVLIAEFLGYSRLRSGLAIAMGIMISAAIVLIASFGIASLL